eukprot:PhM_4_TR12684/c0_g1_i1/m.17158
MTVPSTIPSILSVCIFAIICIATSTTVHAEKIKFMFADRFSLQPVDSYSTGCSDVSDPECTGGWARANALVREERASNPNLVFIPSIDQQSRVTNLHPDGFALNRKLFSRASGASALTVDYWIIMSPYESRTLPYAVSMTLEDQLVLTNAIPPIAFGQAIRGYSVITVGATNTRVLFLSLIDSYSQVFTFRPEKEIRDGLVQRLKKAVKADLVVVRMISTFDSASTDILERMISDDVDVVVGSIYGNGTGDPYMRRINTTDLVYEQRKNMNIFEVDTVTKRVIASSVRARTFSTLSAAQASTASYKADEAVLQSEVDIASANNVKIATSAGAVATSSSTNNICRTTECAAGNMWTEILYKQTPSAQKIDFVVLNGGAVRAGWEAGSIGYAELLGSMPFANRPCVATMWGIDVYNMFNHSVEAVPPYGDSTVGYRGTGRFLQMYNARISFNPARNDTSKLNSVEIYNSKTKTFEPINRRKKYTFATTDYICGGGDGFGDVLKFTDTPELHDADLLGLAVQYMENLAGKIFVPVLDGRIRRDYNTSIAPFQMFPVTQKDCEVGTFWNGDVNDCDECPPGYFQPLPGQNKCELRPAPAEAEKVTEKWWFYIIIIIPVGVIICLALYTRHQRHVILMRTRDTTCAPREGQDLTIIFTDIQSSTKLWNAHKHAMGDAVKTHHKIIRDVIARHRAYEVKTIGDSFMIVAQNADTGVRIANDIQLDLIRQNWSSELLDHPDARQEFGADGSTLIFSGVRVRIGLHTGQPEVIYDEIAKGYDYYGDAVNTAARVESIAAGGQTVLSPATLESLSEDIKTVSVITQVGEVELRGLPAPVMIHQVLPSALASRNFENKFTCALATSTVQEFESRSNSPQESNPDSTVPTATLVVEDSTDTMDNTTTTVTSSHSPRGSAHNMTPPAVHFHPALQARSNSRTSTTASFSLCDLENMDPIERLEYVALRADLMKMSRVELIATTRQLRSMLRSTHRESVSMLYDRNPLDPFVVKGLEASVRSGGGAGGGDPRHSHL